MCINNIKRGNIFYSDLSPVVGSEQGEIRPVLILQLCQLSHNCNYVLKQSLSSKIKQTPEEWEFVEKVAHIVLS